MEDSDPRLRNPLGFIFFVLFLLPFHSHATPFTAYEVDLLTEQIMTFADDDVKERLQSIDQQLVEYRFDPAVRYIIRKYVVNWRGGSERILGRASTYFPIFEKHLAEAGLPDALKYLSITESALVTRAVSRVGAQGLWQFMPATATEYGLLINAECDERLDPNQSTLAAIAYLKDQYAYFGDWALALAAYNAGQGGVRRAMRRSRKKTFWGIQKYLPRETRGYVPGFIAATYLAEFFSQHDLQPDLPVLDEQLTESFLLHEVASFYRIAQVTGLSIETIERLNPGYHQGYVPASDRGHYLILPRRVAGAWRDYLTLGQGHAEERALSFASPFLTQQQIDGEALPIPEYQTLTYQVQQGDSLTYIAAQLEVSPMQLRLWNKINGVDSLRAGRELHYFTPVEYLKFQRDIPAPVEIRLPAVAINEDAFLTDTATPLPRHLKKTLYYLDKRQKPSKLAAKIDQVNTADLLSWNDLTDNKALPVGSVVKINMLR